MTVSSLTPGSAPNDAAHIPVMRDEMLHCMAPKKGEIYVDGTFGAGGYTRALLEAADCIVYAIDRDPLAINKAKHLALSYPHRLFPLQGCFGDMAALLKNQGIDKVNGIVLDIGVSSMQIDTAARGFSFRNTGPLDMRMSQDGQTAADVVNTFSEQALADILFSYGEERASRKIAKEIIARRPLATTQDLVQAVHAVLPMHGGLKTDTATRTFQALRIFVNDELGELERALNAAEEVLAPEGRLVVVSFHSLEDGLVKKFFRQKSGRAAQGSRHLPPLLTPEESPRFSLKTPGGIKPSASEKERNPRARSAILRWGVRKA